jgi:hypothetical protein
MERVIVERLLADPVDLDALLASASASAGCFAAHRVRWLRSLVSLDGRRLLCEYEAPDAESVREANRRAGLPFERAWTARELAARS